MKITPLPNVSKKLYKRLMIIIPITGASLFSVGEVLMVFHLVNHWIYVPMIAVGVINIMIPLLLILCLTEHKK